MHNDNPYRAPSADVAAWASEGDAVDSDCWRDGKELVARHGARLPARCIKCNGDAEPMRKPRRFYWHHAGFYLLILINLLVYALVALGVRKKTELYVGLCTAHRQRRQRLIAAAWLASLAGIALIFLAVGGPDRGGVALGGIGLLAAGLLTGVLGTRVLTPVRIDDVHARLRGCDERFLRELPPFAERARRR